MEHSEEFQDFKRMERLFAPERQRLNDEIQRRDESINRYRSELDTARTELRELKEREKTRNASVPRSRPTDSSPKKVRNRVIYYVTATLNADAAPLAALLWDERRKLSDVPELGLKVTTVGADGVVVKMVVDYTVKGGYPADIERMLEKTAKKIGLEVLHVDCDEQSRQPVDDDLNIVDS